MTQPSLGVSAIICCHNSASRLPETLKRLAGQRLLETIPWEVILVDNASTDNTAGIAREQWASEGSPAPLRVVDEPQLGLSYGRKRGITNSQYDALVFVDDDNWLADDYLRVASDILAQGSRIGAAGGPTGAVYERTPPQWFPEVQANFAIGPQARSSGDITEEKPFLAGAGLVLRRSAYDNLSHAGFKFLLSGRKGREASSGEDTELGYALALRGYRIWYDERLKLEHFIPARRLTTDAVFDLNRNINRAAVYCSLYAAALQDGERAPIRRYFADLRRAIWWCCKAVLKFLLGKGHFIGVRLQFQSLATRISELPGFLRAVREHYPRILALRRQARS